MSILRFCVLAFFIIVVLWIAGFIAFLTHAAALKPHPSKTAANAIIVLTGGQNRIRTGLNLFSNDYAPNLFITGVYKGTSRQDVLAQHTSASALPDCCLILGRKATTTLENAEETYEWITKNHIRRIYLVTSSYHMMRARLVFSHKMPNLKIIPYSVNENGNALKSHKFWTLAFSEYNKFIFRWLSIAIERAR